MTTETISLSTDEERLVLEQIELLVRHTVLQRPLDMQFILNHAEMLVQFAECACGLTEAEVQERRRLRH